MDDGGGAAVDDGWFGSAGSDIDGGLTLKEGWY